MRLIVALRRRAAQAFEFVAPPAAAAAALAALVLIGLAVAAAASLSYTGMWWDESASFWGSQGLSRYAEPFAKPGGVRDVIRMNRAENLDPGGFHLLLHFWTKMGRGLAWLRALPFAFFLVGVACLGLLGWRVSGSPLFGAAASAAPLLVPGALYFAFEVRAFSMEMAGVAAAALALVLALENPSPARFLLLGVTCGAFLSSRYSFAFAAGAATCVALAAARRDSAPRREAAARGAAVLLPVLVAGAAIARATTTAQLWSEMRGGPLGVTAPEYTRESVLAANPHAGSLWLHNLASPAALPITAAALFFLFLRRRAYTAATGPAATREVSGPGRALGPLYVFVVVVQCLSAAASLLGAYPWEIASRWSAYLLMVSALSAVLLAADGVVLGRLVRGRREAGRRSWNAARTAGAAAAILAAALGSARAARFHREESRFHRTDLAAQIDRLPVAGLPERSVFVTYYEVPVLRYLYEYGPYAGRSEYPGLFRLESVAEWTAQAAADAGPQVTAYVVTALSLPEAQARFPRSALVRACAGECRLLRVVRPSPASGPG